MENFLLWGFYILTFYAFLPGIISRTFGFRVFKKGRAGKEIALTFDDGPDPLYTPQLLDLLKRYDAKATFFVVGVHAERHPDLLRRMHEEGHIIGIHNYVHKTNWLVRPGTVKKQIHRTAEVIKKATGERPTYYRPPWGIVNLFDFSNLGYLQIILWSALFGDWRKHVGAERLRKRMMKKLRPGEVLLLHDCGATFGADKEAPVNMLLALESFLSEGSKRGLRFVHVSEMIELTDKNKATVHSLGLFKRMLIACWMGWEKVFHVLFRIKSTGNDAVFHHRIVKYRGKTLHLNNGRTIEDKDPVLELHFDNQKLFQIMMDSRSIMHSAIRLIREVEKEMPRLAASLAGHKEYAKIRGLYGISMINRGAEQFGFSVLELPPGLFDKMARVYLKTLMKVLHPSGKQRVRDRGRGDRLSPRILAMSIDEFWDRFGTDQMNSYLWPSAPAFEEQAEALNDAALRL